MGISTNSKIFRGGAVTLLCVYLFANVAVSVLHPFFHHHSEGHLKCECADNTPVHFHKTHYNLDGFDDCPVCQHRNYFALIEYYSSDYKVVFSKNAQKFDLPAKKYAAFFSTSSPRAPPVF